VVFRCKMCGGDLNINIGDLVCKCDFCDAEQTLPKLNSDRKANLYDRADHFRRNNDYDKAMEIYEQILNEDSEDSESYWSIVLCRYGIEYVEDPASHKMVPTINRTQYTSIYADEDYKAAIRYANETQRAIYECEAKTIDEIQKGILIVSEKEEPFDVFICYKETDASGRRTPDSVLATDLYKQLTQEGFKVFFSRITLENKLGYEYEPYIFAALNSAKVMIVLGTRREYFEAAWVRNEWSRYLALIRNGTQKILIPAYKDMDPYDLPEEFSHLQALDMSRLGFVGEVIRKINIGQTNDGRINNSQININPDNEDTLLKRGFFALEDKDNEGAEAFFSKVLESNDKCADAWLGRFFAKYDVRGEAEFVNTFTNLYDDDFLCNLTVSSQNIRRIEKEINSYIVEGYLPYSKAKCYFDFKNVENKKDMYVKMAQRDEFKEKVCEDEFLINARKYLSDDRRSKLDQMIAEINAELDRRILRARKEHGLAENDNRCVFELMFEEACEKIGAEYEKVCLKREDDYQALVKRINDAKDSHDLENIRDGFYKMGDYKDSLAFAIMCRDKQNTISRSKFIKKNIMFIGVAVLIAIAIIVLVMVIK